MSPQRRAVHVHIQMRNTRSRSRIAPNLIVLGFYLLVALIATYPLMCHLDEVAIGDPANDVWNHLWGFWWVKHEIVSHHRFPVATQLLNHPRGGALFFIDLLNALLSIPLQLVFSLTTSYNIIILLNLTFNGFGAYLLARHLTRNPYASLITGVVYGFCPHLLAQVYNGISETIDAGWLPLSLLYVIRTFQESRRSNAILAGFFLFMTTFANWYYGLFGLFFAVCYLVAQLWYSWRRVVNPNMFGRLLYLGLTYAVLITPLLMLFSYTLSADNAIVGRDPEFVYQTLIRHNMTDLLIFFHPGNFYSPDLKALYGEDLIIVGYIGYSVLLLGLLPLARHRGREVRFWAIMAAVFFVFSLGPFLYVDGAYFEIRGRWIPLPFLLFFKAFPLFSRISHAFRFVVMVMLSLGILAAFGLKGVYARSSWRLPSIAGTLLLSSVVLAEFLFFSPAKYPINTSRAHLSEVYSRLQEEPGDFAILDLPLGVPTLKRAMYAYAQTVHQKRIPYGLNDPFPANLASNYFVRYMVNLEFANIDRLPRDIPAMDLMASLMLMKAQAYRYVIVHDDLFFNSAQAEKVHGVLRWFLGLPERYPDDHLSIYRIE